MRDGVLAPSAGRGCASARDCSVASSGAITENFGDEDLTLSECENNKDAGGFITRKTLQDSQKRKVPFTTRPSDEELEWIPEATHRASPDAGLGGTFFMYINPGGCSKDEERNKQW